MTSFISVMAAKVDDRVALWEVHPDHPTGEIWIVGDGKPHEVAETLRVAAKLKDGALIRVQTYSEPEPTPETFQAVEDEPAEDAPKSKKTKKAS